MKVRIFYGSLFAMAIFYMSSCTKKNPLPTPQEEKLTSTTPVQKKEKPSTTKSVTYDITTKPGFLGKADNPASQAKKLISQLPKELIESEQKKTPSYLSFFVQNASGTPLYTTCFAYVKPRPFHRWRWRKSKIYEIKPGEKIEIKIRVLDDEKDKNHIFGALAVFPNKIEAKSATYELLRDENKLDLDLMSDLEGKTVVIGIERYGFREPFYDYDFLDKQGKNESFQAELDFFVQNKTGKTLFVTGFIYTKKAKSKWIAAEDAKDDMSVWRFYKTKVLKLENNQTGYIDVDSIIPKRDRVYVRGYLGVFNENQEEDAHNKTYELLSDQERVNLGTLAKRQGKTVVLEVERYGVANDIIDFTVKPIRWIDFTKIIH